MGVKKCFFLNGKKFEVNLQNNGSLVTIKQEDGSSYEYFVTQIQQKQSGLKFLVNNRMCNVSFDAAHEKFFIQNKQHTIQTVSSALNSISLPSLILTGARVADGVIKSPLAGRVVRVLGAAGAWVCKGQPLVVIESMKMENEICANRDGIIKTLFIAQGNLVQPNQSLVELEMKGGRDGEPKGADDQTPI